MRFPGHVAPHHPHSHPRIAIALLVAIVAAWFTLIALAPWSGHHHLPVPAPIPVVGASR